jgi:hypothetical protein
MSDPENLLESYRNRLEHGASVEDLIRILRFDGFSKVQSVKALVDLSVANLTTAKELIHTSATWADVRKRDDEFHRKLR